MSLLLLFVAFSLFQTPIHASKKPYIVYLGAHSHGPYAKSADYKQVEDSHNELLGSILGGKEKAKEAIVHSYTKNINGFAAMLDQEEADEISKHPEVISVFQNKYKNLHTTRSWDFLGLETKGRIPLSSLWPKTSYGEDVIIATLDSGVWPESKSFSDEGMGPVPKRWKGFCQNNTEEGVPCNKKLIGSTFFNKGQQTLGVPLGPNYYTPRDFTGHGTHTLSTAAGDFVPNANVFGQANGTAKGGSPGARVAAYRVCFTPVNIFAGECYDVDILAGFEAAIHDGVDVISLSLGGSGPIEYFEDAISIGSFHAVQNGIVVVASAGNDGPDEETVSNVAPWILTVGAGTVDRDFVALFTAGDGRILEGRSASDKKLEANKMYPLIKSEDAGAPDVSTNDSKICLPDSLDPKMAGGKIVVCAHGFNERMEKAEEVRRAGGVGMVIVNVNDDQPMSKLLFADTYHIPAVHISYEDGESLFSYMNSTRSPVGTISPAKTYYGRKQNPKTAIFSSRGPNPVTPQILKPDVIAPGVDILASISQAAHVDEITPLEKSRPPFYLLSGTSMACPHVSGIVGLIKSLHPNWSPAMIRSAIMTTATTLDNIGEPIKDQYLETVDPFSYGSGHVRPNLAADPGLVYDLKNKDYIRFLCSLGYNSTKMQSLLARSYSCHSNSNAIESMNYPSIAVPNLNGTITLMRVVTNVGKPSTYNVKVESPEELRISVRPTTLVFNKYGQKRKFRVTINATSISIGKEYKFGALVWSDGRHNVRSPIVVR